MRKEIRRIVLTNAVKYNGKANAGSIIGTLIQLHPEVKDKIKDFMKEINEQVNKINKLSLDEQKRELENLGGAEEIKREERGMFDFLGIKKGDKIITGFPPGPEKYPHIGHAKAALINYLLAQEYNGEFIPRFEDTNPELVKKEFYDILLDNMAWLGVKWKKWYYASDFMEEYYKSAEKLIKNGEMYVCYCDQETTSMHRKKGTECECRNNNKQLEKWNKFFKAKVGSSVVRLKIDMKHKNSTMRDPAMFRIINTPHARCGKKYRVWPTYDFQNAFMDGKFKITHRLRTKEFEMRAELQRYIQKLLGFPITHTYEFGRFNMQGVPSSGRIIREGIAKKKFIGWDDPRLTTIVALRRRGFLPEAIKEFVLSTGISKADSTITWGDLIIRNKRILDSTAKRYFFIDKPKKVKIKDVVNKIIKVNLHPEKDLGVRSFKIDGEFYVGDKIEKDKMYRLMHLFNFKDRKFVSDRYDQKLEAKIIHWLPIKQTVNVEIFMDNGKWIKGLGEVGLKEVKVGEVIQFERFAFCRLDKKIKNTYQFWFTHR